MIEAPLHHRESDRIKALQATELLDTPPESAYDDVARLASILCDAPRAFFSLVDEHRQWFKAHIGTEIIQTPRCVAFCAHAVASERTLVVEDARRDPRFDGNPLVEGIPPVVFYAGAVVYSPEGLPLGVVCVNDERPRRISHAQVEALEALARQTGALVAARLDCQRLEQYAVELSEARVRLEVQASELEDANERLSKLASTNALTGLANRRTLMNRLDIDAALVSSTRPLAVIMFDIDDFKGFNDAFGHPAGDVVLREVAELAGSVLRPGDLLARYGGEEFCVLLPGLTAEKALPVAERIRETIGRAEWPQRKITVSLGVAGTDKRQPAASLVASADGALYVSKRNGRNQTTVASPPC